MNVSKPKLKGQTPACVLPLVIGRLFHKCVFDRWIQKEYSVMYSNKWIIYTQISCKCGRHKELKMCGTLDIENIPEWALLNAL